MNPLMISKKWTGNRRMFRHEIGEEVGQLLKDEIGQVVGQRFAEEGGLDAAPLKEDDVCDMLSVSDTPPRTAFNEASRCPL